MDTDFGERLDTVNQDDIGVIPKEIKDAAERRRIKHEKALQSIKEINTIYDKDGEIIESDDIVFTPDDKYFCIVFDENGKAKAHKLRGSSIPLVTYVNIYEENIYDNLLHRRWTKEEKDLYNRRSIFQIFRLLQLIGLLLISLSHPGIIGEIIIGEIEIIYIIGIGAAILVFLLYTHEVHTITKKLRNYNKDDQ